MNPFTISIIITFFGLILELWWIAGIGIIGFLMSLVSHYSQYSTPKKTSPSGGLKHKVLQTPGAWDDDEMLTYYAALSGPGAPYQESPEDPLRVLSKKGIPADVTRNVLPFRGYGRKSLFEQMFIGFPVNIGTLIKKK